MRGTVLFLYKLEMYFNDIAGGQYVNRAYFNNGNSQALRLPKGFRFDADEVIIKKVGDMVILLPKKYKAETLLATFEEMGQMEIDREQPMEQQERDFNDRNVFWFIARCCRSTGTQQSLMARYAKYCKPRECRSDLWTSS